MGKSVEMKKMLYEYVHVAEKLAYVCGMDVQTEYVETDNPSFNDVYIDILGEYPIDLLTEYYEALENFKARLEVKYGIR